ncbi:acetoin utilization protein AcuB [Alkalispirochaeta americana]|uniref:Acetoin utilization protein AcuB n=1 Tax=Alkalispirochaeta americana TaxID=159291 RepID=A0A1N6TXY1_9SPIO|nr:CBS and ACT domain-containing protein [Alkalispirochaeta americana]SIQ58184.1 acetoin utilization protein AcuB [Alkalispirochaeta americana]
MLVKNIMSRNLFVAHPKTTVTDAQETMRRENIHHLPVIDDHTKKLVGIVSEKDLLYASPSPASTLDVYEMTRLLSKLSVGSVMAKKVVSAHPQDLVEDAARKMVDHDIGCLPIVDEDNYPVGIITESDMFRLFIDLFGTREKGLRATLRIPEEPGELAKLGSDVSDHNGNIVSIGTWPGERPTDALCIMKVTGMTREQFLSSVEKHILEVIDIREV